MHTPTHMHTPTQMHTPAHMHTHTLTHTHTAYSLIQFLGGALSGAHVRPKVFYIWSYCCEPGYQKCNCLLMSSLIFKD